MNNFLISKGANKRHHGEINDLRSNQEKAWNLSIFFNHMKWELQLSSKSFDKVQKSMDTLPPIIMVTKLEKLSFKNILSCLVEKIPILRNHFFGGKVELHF